MSEITDTPADLPEVRATPQHHHKLRLARYVARDVTPSRLQTLMSSIRDWFRLPRTKLGLLGLFLVWWGFTLRYDASHGLKLWYLAIIKGVSFSKGQNSYYYIQNATQELHEFGGIVIVFAIPLLWMAVWDWLRPRRS